MQAEINSAITILKQGGLLLYPTDTIWGIGCDATNFEAVEKIYNLKKREDSKSLICLVNDFKMLERYIEDVPENAIDILKYATQPTTIIYDRPLHIAENLISGDNSLAIRIIRNTSFVNELIQKFKKPIVSTSANISGKPAPKSFKEISQEVLKGVDYVVNLPNVKSSSKPSTIIKLSNDGKVKVIRQ